MLEVQGIDIFYGEVQAVRNLSLKVDKGQIVALLGSNGAGKTTTLKTISGLLRPKKGIVKLENIDLNRIPPSSIVANGVALVPEGRKLFPQMTVEDNLMVGAYKNVHWRKRKDRIIDIYDFFPKLKERRNQNAGTLSGGEQQMVAIGRALMSNPKLLMLDEPSLGLAPNIVESIFSLLKDLNKNGITILLVEQNANLALEISDYAYVMETGEITLEGEASSLMNNVYVKQAYLGL